MLLELRVKNLGIIEDINWRPVAGLNAITGETGAGKSLIIDAVELLLNAPGGDEVIRYGAADACIEGLFALGPDDCRLKSLLAEKGLSQDEEVLAISFDIRKQKPAVVRINGHLATRTVLRQLGQLLVDIHGQSEHLSLLDKKNHLDFLDAYAHLSPLRDSFSRLAARFQQIEADISSMEQKSRDTARQEEFLRYQMEEIQRAGLHVREDEELDNERRLISYSEKLKDFTSRISAALYNSEAAQPSSSAVARVNEAVRYMKKLVELDSSLKTQMDNLEKTAYTLEEVARDIRSYGERLEYNPGRLEEIELRLEMIHSLKRKYGRTIEDILAYREKIALELAAIGQSSEDRLRLEKERSNLKTDLESLAAQLSAARTRAALGLAADVRKELDDLEMPRMNFQVALSSKPAEKGLMAPDGQSCAFTPTGIDEVEFLVSTNPGEPLKPLVKIASTGEVSRFTLALKGALAEVDSIPVLIFDEIDIGVGGRSGDIIGKKLCRLAKNHQVICVTHLPQIAAYADAHFRVHKEIKESRAASILEELTENTRVEEMAAMLAGPAYTPAALVNAGELRQKAANWKLAT